MTSESKAKFQKETAKKLGAVLNSPNFLYAFPLKQFLA